MRAFTSIKNDLKHQFLWLLYRRLYIPIKACQIRHKKKIKVLFILTNFGAWKTESIYRAMLHHNRFKPMLFLRPAIDEDDRENLIEYCLQKGYKFTVSEKAGEPYWNEFKSDIVFYEKPYDWYADLWNSHWSLFCYTAYSFKGSLEPWNWNHDLEFHTWQIYYETLSTGKSFSKILNHHDPHCRNGYNTGIPTMDELMVDKKNVPDPWKVSVGKKRIIYAPHHSITPDSWCHFSSFLENGETMLELAEKYSDKVQWAFKPHPLLRGELEKHWGKEKTDQYYDRWARAEWSQYEQGKYLGLFKHSDALIHDCGSFIVEYFYTGNPLMYLTKREEMEPTNTDLFKEAFKLHYKASTREDIEQFIQNVINGVDTRKEEREAFCHKELALPYGYSATQNIIDCILSRKAAKKFHIPV